MRHDVGRASAGEIFFNVETEIDAGLPASERLLLNLPMSWPRSWPQCAASRSRSKGAARLIAERRNADRLPRSISLRANCEMRHVINADPAPNADSQP
jgi:hypothetical protein